MSNPLRRGPTSQTSELEFLLVMMMMTTTRLTKKMKPTSLRTSGLQLPAFSRTRHLASLIHSLGSPIALLAASAQWLILPLIPASRPFEASSTAERLRSHPRIMFHELFAVQLRNRYAYSCILYLSPGLFSNCGLCFPVYIALSFACSLKEISVMLFLMTSFGR